MLTQWILPIIAGFALWAIAVYLIWLFIALALSANEEDER